MLLPWRLSRPRRRCLARGGSCRGSRTSGGFGVRLGLGCGTGLRYRPRLRFGASLRLRLRTRLLLGTGLRFGDGPEVRGGPAAAGEAAVEDGLQEPGEPGERSPGAGAGTGRDSGAGRDSGRAGCSGADVLRLRLTLLLRRLTLLLLMLLLFVVDLRRIRSGPVEVFEALSRTVLGSRVPRDDSSSAAHRRGVGQRWALDV